MKVRRRIIAFVLASLLFIALLIAAMAIAMQSAERFAHRIEALQVRFEVVAELDAHASDYSAAIIRVLLLGEVEMPVLQAARVQMARTLANLTRATREEIATLRGAEHIQSELPAIENARRIAETYFSIDRAATRALVLKREGRPDDAMDVYDRDVAFRLANELRAQISRELVNERAEIAGEIDYVDQLQRTTLLAAGVIALIAAASAAFLGRFVYRSISVPLAQLDAAAAAAVEAGHRYEAKGREKDEFSPAFDALDRLGGALALQRANMQRASEQLSEEVETRTRQLSEANARLRSIDGRRAQFLADVSHQLRTPLTILRGEADVALRGRHSEADQQEALRRIQGQAVEMGQLLEDLISFARADAESYQHTPETISIENVIAAAVREAGVLAERREVAIDIDVEEETNLVHADFRRLKQALVIGLDNAIKHSPPGSRIIVEAARDNGRVRIAILDQGPGIAEADLPRVFERFYRARSEDHLLNSGLGIGLAIAKDIVDRHQGTISLENRPEGGAMLQITLPAQMERAE